MELMNQALRSVDGLQIECKNVCVEIIFVLKIKRSKEEVKGLKGLCKLKLKGIEIVEQDRAL